MTEKILGGGGAGGEASARLNQGERCRRIEGEGGRCRSQLAFKHIEPNNFIAGTPSACWSSFRVLVFQDSGTCVWVDSILQLA